MRVYQDGVRCFTCNKSWDVFAFVMEMDRCDFRTAFKRLGGSDIQSPNSDIYREIRQAVRTSRGNQKDVPTDETSIEQTQRWTEEIHQETENILRALRICQDADLITEPGSDEWHYLKTVEGYLEEMLDNYTYDWRVVLRILDNFAGRKRKKRRDVDEEYLLGLNYSTLKELEDEISRTHK